MARLTNILSLSMVTALLMLAGAAPALAGPPNPAGADEGIGDQLTVPPMSAHAVEVDVEDEGDGFVVPPEDEPFPDDGVIEEWDGGGEPAAENDADVAPGAASPEAVGPAEAGSASAVTGGDSGSGGDFTDADSDMTGTSYERVTPDPDGAHETVIATTAGLAQQDDNGSSFPWGLILGLAGTAVAAIALTLILLLKKQNPRHDPGRGIASALHSSPLD